MLLCEVLPPYGKMTDFVAQLPYTGKIGSEGVCGVRNNTDDYDGFIDRGICCFVRRVVIC